MKLNLYSVRDTVAGAFCRPFAAPNNGLAIRDFDFAARDPESQISKTPQDYCLFLVGSFDEETGVITAQTPELLKYAITNPLNQE